MKILAKSLYRIHKDIQEHLDFFQGHRGTKCRELMLTFLFVLQYTRQLKMQVGSSDFVFNLLHVTTQFF